MMATTKKAPAVQARQPVKLAIEYWPRDRVLPFPDNARIHPLEQVRELAALIRQFGWTAPIVVDGGGVIIAGHGRLQAAALLEEALVPVVVRTDLSEVEVRALRLADNRLPLSASWDPDLLRRELKVLQAEGVMPQLLGFKAGELEELFGATEEEEKILGTPMPEIPKKAIYSKPGDVWILGPHRLVCGDAQFAETWSRVLAEGDPDPLCLWTDPPYGVDYKGAQGRGIVNDDRDDAKLEKMLRAVLAQAFAHTAKGAAWYVAAPSGPQHQVFARVLLELGVWRQSLVWVKDGFVLGHSDYHYRHEAIFYGWKPGAQRQWFGNRTKETVAGETFEASPLIVEPWGENQVQVKVGDTLFAITGDNLKVEQIRQSVIEIERPRRSKEPPTMKPPALVAAHLRNSSARSDVVVDCFAGSGSTLLACEALGRRARCIELDPVFADVIVTRYLNSHEGTAAYNQRTGETIQTLLGAG